MFHSGTSVDIDELLLYKNRSEFRPTSKILLQNVKCGILNNLRKLRLKKSLSQAELGKLLGVQNTAVSMYEREDRSLDDKTIRKLCGILGCSADYLLCLSDSPEPAISANDSAILRAYHAATEKERRIIDSIVAKHLQE